MGTRSQNKAHGPLSGHVEVVRTGHLEAGYAPGTVAAHLVLLRLLDQRTGRFVRGRREIPVGQLLVDLRRSPFIGAAPLDPLPVGRT